MKLRESNWILTFIASHKNVLRNVHFVRSTKAAPRSMKIATKDSNEIAFRFRRNQIVTEEPEKAFHDIRLNREEPLYIELHFENWRQCSQYALVLEDNPFIQESGSIMKEDREEAERITAYSLMERRRELLIKEIDLALDKRDQARFTKLSAELKEIEQILLNQPLL